MIFDQDNEQRHGATSPCVEAGMTMEQVLAAMGDPDRAESFPLDGTRITIWLFDNDTNVVVVWFDGRGVVTVIASD